LKALLLASEYPPMIGGLSNYSYNVANRLSQTHDLTLLTRTFTSKFEMLKTDYALWRKAKKIIRQEKPDIVYSLYFRIPFSLIHGYAKKCGVSNVAQGFGTDVIRSHPYVKIGRKLAYRISDKVICSGFFHKNSMVKEGCNPDKIRVVYDGVDTEVFKPLYSREKEELRKALDVEHRFVLFSTGRLVKRKGFDDVIKAVKILEKDIPSLTLLISGEGKERRNLEHLIKTLRIEDKVKLLGYVPDDLYPKYFGTADLYVAGFKTIGTDIEGFPITVAEAMSLGLPIVSTHHTAIPDIVKDKMNGLLGPEGSPEDLARLIKLLYVVPELGRSMGLRNRQKAIRQLDWSVVVRKIENILLEVTQRWT